MLELELYRIGISGRYRSVFLGITDTEGNLGRYISLW
jgi:hypothetical protein